MNKKVSFLILLILLNVVLFAQNGQIRGRVIDREKLALPAATIYIESLNKGVISDVNGFYTIVNVPSGEQEVTVSYIGFMPVTQKITVESGKTALLDFELMPGLEMEEIVVTGRLQGQSKALNKQRNSTNITNVIASDQVGKFPDANIGDALKRIPGINVQYDQGEARFGNIRGTAPEYNSVTINGERIPSAEAEVREVQLDLVPSDMIQMVEVNKAVTPDMDADAIGASVNLVTKSAPYDRRISGTIGSGYNILAQKPMLTGAVMYGDRFLKDKKLGMVLSLSYHNHQLGSDNVEAEWGGDDDNAYIEELQVRQYYLQRVRQSYSAAFDYKINENHTINLKGMYNHRNDWENRYRNIFETAGSPDESGVYAGEVLDDVGEDGIEGTDDDEYAETVVAREVKAGANDKNGRLEDQRMMQFSLSGDHLFGKLKADWAGSYSKASEDRPQERYLEYEIEGVDIYGDLSNSEFPLTTIKENQNINEEWDFKEITEENQYTEDEDIVGRINFELPLVEGKFENSIKFGGKYKIKSKYRKNNFFQYSVIDEDAFRTEVLANMEDITKDNFIPGDKYDVGMFPKKEFLGELDLTDESKYEKEADYSEYAGNFDAEETVMAGYLMLNQNFGNKLSAIAGVRYEQTSSKNTGREFDDSQNYEGLDDLPKTDEEKNDYTNILPNLHLRYSPMQNTVLRFAYTNTISRPRYFDLVPYIQIEDEEEISIGNPNLEPTTSSNIDFMFEQYFKSIGIISGGFFYKDIKDFMVNENHEDYDYNGTTWDKFTRPINGGNAILWGVEIAAQRQLDFLPGVLNGLGVYANYTYTKSEITDFNIEGREDETGLAMPGSPKHTLNTSLSYDKEKFTARISFNYAADFVDEFGEEAFEDVYYDQVNYLDLNLTYGVNENFTIFADLNNILDQPLRYYQGAQLRTYQAEYYGMRIQAGIKFDFN